ncbi:MAG: quinolinate synthase NadA, partial [Halobacteriovoraceae bacterium]|nr:quinolinate synthase NadA [Halobacteriovoraceae bacterium]
MLDLFKESKGDHLLPVREEELSDQAVIAELHQLKKELGDRVCVLGHHYQSNEIIQFADIRGDSLALAKHAAEAEAEYIVFCGVHFMAETADMLTGPEQSVILPDLNAGCSMADMAQSEGILKCWQQTAEASSDTVVPITYINCSAELKAFVGDHGGAICTSSNARKVIEWAFEQGQKLLFFPDQHLGRNTCF